MTSTMNPSKWMVSQGPDCMYFVGRIDIRTKPVTWTGLVLFLYYSPHSHNCKRYNIRPTVLNPQQANGARLLAVHLRAWLFLLFLVQGQEGDTGHLDDLETHTGNITDGMAATTETGNEHFIVFIDVVQATIAGDEGSDLLAVLDQLHTARLTNGRVRLLGFNTNLFQDNTLGHGRTTQWVGLHCRHGVRLVVRLLVPSLRTAVDTQLASATNTSGLVYNQSFNTPFPILHSATYAWPSLSVRRKQN
ncbi:hypothetical protein Ae201684P_005236 [Aphanomyces euteiches]|uniref:Uncharacterized protein n=1 Tax=Aphanomyces euteiches TaxID=100861 RepID=A0A6G0X3I0_9STRA|nr:hypothetical protein Ae201684_008828 [Aphanomyces euteiches]KAH9085530.1 hypothetical protein Ae201684P_005236 [Aphanomyces euteiches]